MGRGPQMVVESIWRARSCGYRADLGFICGRSMFIKLGIGLLC